jgi:hypothetical protein
MSEAIPAILDAEHLPETLKRLDDLISRTGNIERLRSGLGMRLALSFAQELRDRKPLGTDTAAIVAEWTERYGEDTVNAAVAIAREFLTRPNQLAKEFAMRLNNVRAEASAVDGKEEG